MMRKISHASHASHAAPCQPVPIPACDCGALAMAIRPGTNPETCELLGTVLIMKTGEPDAAWCLDCWLKRFGTSQHRDAPTMATNEVAE
jgi:hypothetical protein